MTPRKPPSKISQTKPPVKSSVTHEDSIEEQPPFYLDSKPDAKSEESEESTTLVEPSLKIETENDAEPVAGRKPKGLVHLALTEVANPNQQRKPGNPFPVLFKLKTFLANGVTVGVSEAQVRDLIATTKSYYKIKAKFFPAMNATRLATTSEDFAVSTLERVQTYFGSRDFAVFCSKDTRPEVIEMVGELVREDDGEGLEVGI